MFFLSCLSVDMKVKRPAAPLEIQLEPRGVHEEFSIFKPPEGEPKIRTSPQLLLATHRFLSRGESHFTSVVVFVYLTVQKKFVFGKKYYSESVVNMFSLAV